MRVRFVCFLLPGALVVAACNTDRSEPARRDLTLLPSAESATAAVVSARELDLANPDERPFGDRRAGTGAQPGARTQLASAGTKGRRSRRRRRDSARARPDGHCDPGL